MTGFFKYTYALLLVLCFSSGLKSQIVYALGITPQNGCQVYAVDVQTCEYCAIGPASCGNAGDLLMFQDGSYAIFTHQLSPLRGVIYTFTPPNYGLTILDGPVGSTFVGAVIGPNGLVYINGYYNGQPALFSYDPITQQIDFLGNLPIVMLDIFFIGGELYGVGASIPPSSLWQIDINDPVQSVQLQALPTGLVASSACAVGNLVYIASQNKLYEHDIVTNTTTEICDFNGLILAFGIGLSAPPPNGPPYVCSCETSAGTMQDGSLDFCVPQNASATHNNDHFLDADDLLQFILYSDPADPTGSIIATSATPDFSFAAPLQSGGVPYYIAAIAGNDLNGAVNLDDPCLDVSDGIEVAWHSPPSVEFSVSESDICPGNCQTIDAVFMGTPPFSLTISTPAGMLTEVFSDLSGSFQVCPPPGTPPGSFLVQATALTDAYCTCSN